MRYRIVVDPGHGGSDPGRIVGSAKEAAIALRVGKRLVDELAERDILCTLTRWDDVFVSLADRAAKANAAGADLFVSIHCNASANELARGPWSIICKGSERAREAAELTQAALESVMGPGRIVTDASVDTGFTRVAQSYFDMLGTALPWRDRIRLTEKKFGEDTYRTLAVLRQTDMPAVLLELGFLTNDNERAKLSNANTHAALASAIADAVVAYLDARDGVS